MVEVQSQAVAPPNAPANADEKMEPPPPQTETNRVAAPAFTYPPPEISPAVNQNNKVDDLIKEASKALDEADSGKLSPEEHSKRLQSANEIMGKVAENIKGLNDQKAGQQKQLETLGAHLPKANPRNRKENLWHQDWLKNVISRTALSTKMFNERQARLEKSTAHFISRHGTAQQMDHRPTHAIAEDTYAL